MKLLMLVPIIDIRIVKFAEYFSKLNYQIKILADKKGDYVWDNRLSQISNLEIEYIHNNDIIPTQIIFDPIRFNKYKKEFKKNKYNFVYTRDIFISYVYLNKLKLDKAKSIVDIADDFVSVLDNTNNKLKKLYHKVVNTKKIEKYVMENADRTIFVCEAAKEHFLNRHSLSIDFSIISNSPNNDNCDFGISTTPNKRILYVGTIDKGIRDFETILKADEYLNSKLQIDCFTFNPTKNVYVKEIIEKSSKCKHLKISFFEAVDNLEYNKLLNEYSIGLIPHHRNNITDFTIPNKIYDYWMNGMYILSSDNPSIVKDFSNINQLFVYEGENPSSFAIIVMKLLSSINNSFEFTPFLYEHTFDYHMKKFISSIN